MNTVPLDNIRSCCEVLGVSPGDSREKVKEAYRDLAKVWHPDRFLGDERLAEKAQEKLKEINDAYHRLDAFLMEREDDSAADRALTRQSAMSEGAPPTPIPFPDFRNTIVYALVAMTALAVAGCIIFAMMLQESRELRSEQDLQTANEEVRRIEAAVAHAKRIAQEDAAAHARLQATDQARKEAADRRRNEIEARRAASPPDYPKASSGETATDAARVAEAESYYQNGLEALQAPGADETEASNLFKKAALLGHAGAQHKLAFNYGSGRGVPRDEIEAYKWFTLAARNGDVSAIQNRRAIETRMTTVQIEEANSRIQEMIEQEATYARRK